MEPLPPNAIYVDMDTVLDTRLGLLRQHLGMTTFPKAYWERDFNDWSSFTDGRLDQNGFYNLWMHRDHATLEHSKITNITFHIVRCIQTILNNAVITEDHREPRIVINTWPYVLTDEEEIDFASAFSQYFIATKTKVECIHVPLADLTPAYVKDNFALMTTYLGVEWLARHHQALAEHPVDPSKGILFGFPLTVPRLYQRSGASLSVKEKQDMHLEMKILMLEFIQQEYIDALWFSEYRPAMVKEETESDEFEPMQSPKSFKL